MMQVVVGIGVLWAIYAAIKSPYQGLLALLVINVVQPGELYPFFNSFHIERLVVLIVLASTVLRHDEHIAFSPLSKKLIVFLVMIVIGIPFAFWPGGSASATLDFAKMVLYNVLIVSLLTTRERFRGFLITYACAIGYLGLTSGWGYYHGDSVFAQGIDRAQGLTNAGGDPNSLAITLVTALPLTVLLLSNASRKFRLFVLAMCALNVATLVLTGSRTGFMCLLVLMTVFTLTRKKAILIAPVMAILVVGIWTAMPAEYKTRYTTVENLKDDESYQNRIISWKSGLHMFEDYPLTGVGIGNFPYANGEKYWPIKNGIRVWLQPHSLYVQLIAETGLLGTVAWLTLLFSMIYTCWRLRRESRDTDMPGWLKHFPGAVGFCIFGLLICGYSAHLLYRHTWYELAAMTAAMALILEREKASAIEFVKPDRAPAIAISPVYVIGSAASSVGK
jgi:probable O-glycosylation ligase (exosortase A-associated)